MIFRPFHPLANEYPLMSQEQLAELAESIRANGQRKPVVLLDGQVLDGRNRWIACMEILKGRPTAIEYEGPSGEADLRAFVVDANVHRMHHKEEFLRTQKAKQAAIAEALKAGPEKSNRAIAAEAGVSDKTVQPVREQLEHGAEIPHHETRSGADGVQQPASKPKRQPKADAAEANGTPAEQSVPSAAPKPPARPMDPFGLPVPEELALVFAPHLEAIRQEALTLCRRLGKLVNEYALSAAGEVFRREMKRTQKAEDEDTARFKSQGLTDLLRQFEQLAPHCSVCPHCEYGERKPGKPCHCCEGRGWICSQIFTKQHGMTPEMRTLLEERMEAANA